jgi:hypothetical protein
MDEETMREQKLSEEQLGEISGGCRACIGDTVSINRSIPKAQMYHALGRVCKVSRSADSEKYEKRRINR